MRIIVNSAEMKWCDSNTISHFQISSLVLMERAALCVAGQIVEELKAAAGRILIVCGNGNNGADGLAVARLLYQRGYQVTVVKAPNTGKQSEENKKQAEILAKYGLKILEEIPPSQYDCVVDALFGIGLSRAPKGTMAFYIQKMNSLPGYKVAIDMPSGVSSDTGFVYEAAFHADVTVTFAYQKLGQLLYPGAENCGEVKVADIGITDESWLERKPHCFTAGPEDFKRLPPRPSHSNKGTFGKALMIAGTKDMAGAALFCAEAAYRTGCGLVKLYTPEENRVVLQTALPEAVLYTYDSGNPEKTLPDCVAASRMSVIAIGPGLGTSETSGLLLHKLLEQKMSIPMVLDADALNLLAKEPDMLAEHTGSPLILTPHVGEMARLFGTSVSQVLSDLPGTAQAFAKKYQVICVLKDARTVTALPDGTLYLNTSGSSAMAKGGSGDILTGMLAGLLAQGMAPEEAAPVGVYLHGLAGEAAALHCGSRGVLARDILKEIGRVMPASYKETLETKRNRGENGTFI